MWIRWLAACGCVLGCGAAWVEGPAVLERSAKEHHAARDYGRCAELYVQAIDAGVQGSRAPYNAACCFAPLGKHDEAFKYLMMAAQRGWSDVEQLRKEEDLGSLHDDPRWGQLIEQCAAARERERAEPSEPALRRELLRRMKEDQAVRTAKNPNAARMRKVDKENTAWMKNVVDKHGWPGRSMVGEDGAIAAFLLVQHADADPAFQARCLELMRDALEKREVRAGDVAFLTDRVLVNQGKKQLYGTQFFTLFGTTVPRPIEDEVHLDARRARMGLMPMAEYKKIMEGRAKAR